MKINPALVDSTRSDRYGKTTLDMHITPLN